MIESMAFLPLMFWLIYLCCCNSDDKKKTTEQTHDPIREIEAYIDGLRKGLEKEHDKNN